MLCEDATCWKVIKLKLEDKGLTTIDLSMEEGKDKVNDLSLHDNKIARVVPGNFEGFKKIKFLTLSKNRICFVHQKAFEGLKHIIHINLMNNMLGEIPDFTSVKTSIKFLFMNENNIVSDSSAHKNVKFPRLTTISLEDNKLSVIPEIVHNSPGLFFLYLNNNKFTKFCCHKKYHIIGCIYREILLNALV